MHDNTIPNFRSVSKTLPCLYRSSSPEEIAETLRDGDGVSSASLSPAENILLNEATLWIDIRTSSEVNVDKINFITQKAPGGPFEKMMFQDPRGLEASLHSARKQRIYMSSKDPAFSMDYVFEYAVKHWVSADAIVATGMISKENSLVMEAISQRGLGGLFEVILDCHSLIVGILQAITLHLEQRKAVGMGANIIFHCTLGKDRTGIVSMLCQSMVGDSDEQIVKEFVKSHCVEELAAVKLRPLFGKWVESSNFTKADAETMKETLAYIRTNPKYGSVDGYLDYIRFDASWRRRFVEAALDPPTALNV
ncbi:protein tyrosine/serine phosphatase [Nitzschia inconspicua]|uniref:Protein tyrosine/serine phosphatase n=1 Tax=Nitzschia inconspicua TaxID=303405 RepID=A0A9K3LWM7_9STRA|nr:protein tyrosine/serine phosphatase [Nitzschia inconspicua]